MLLLDGAGDAMAGCLLLDLVALCGLNGRTDTILQR
jgi:hypothetical protein